MYAIASNIIYYQLDNVTLHIALQDILADIGPSCLLRVQLQNVVRNLLMKTLKEKVCTLMRNGKHFEDLIGNQYVPKMKIIEEKLKIVTVICKSKLISNKYEKCQGKISRENVSNINGIFSN